MKHPILLLRGLWPKQSPMGTVGDCFSALAMTVACGLAITSHPVSAKVVNKVVAVVNSDVITEYDLDRAMASHVSDKSRRRGVLEDLINQKLLKQEIDKAKIEVTDDELAYAVATVLERNRINIEILRAELASKGVPFEAYKEQLKEQVRQNKFIQQNVVSGVSVKEEDVMAYKFERVEPVYPAGTVRLGWVFYPLDEEPSDKEIKKTVLKGRKVADKARRKGADFKKIAKEMADLGEKTLAELPPTVASFVRQMQAGEVSGPIVTPQGVYVVKLYERSLESVSDKEKVDDLKIRQTIYNNRVEQAIDDYLMKIRRKAFIDIRE